MVIAHNISAINTYKSLGMAGGSVNKAMEKLASGFRINKAADDAAGLSISEKMRSQIRGLNQASKNAENGISLIQTAEGALNEVHSILQRVRELAVEAATDTNAQEDRDALQGEISQLINEVDRIGNTTEFNGIKLFEQKEKAANISNDDLSSVTSKINSVISSYNLSGTPSVNLGANGKYSIDISSGLQLGKNITIDGVTKELSTKSAELSIKSTTRFLYNASGDMVYENLPTVTDFVLSGTFNLQHIDSSVTSATRDDILNNYGSLEELVASGKYYVYKLNENAKIENTHDLQHVAGDKYTFELHDENGKIVRICDSNKDNRKWTTSETLWDDSGFKWDTNLTVDNFRLIDGYNYWGYSTGSGKMNVKGGEKQFQLYTDAALTNDINELRSLINEDTSRVQNISKADSLIIDKLKTQIDGLNLKDNDDNLMEASITSSGMGKYEIKMLAKGSAGENTLAFHVGANSNQIISVDLKGMNSDVLDITDVSVTDRDSANTSITTIDNAIKLVSNMRSTFGAIQNRLEYTINNLNTTGENMTAAESTIRDVDMADQMMEYTKSNILQQAAQAMLIQANSRPQQALQLLQ